MAGRLRQRFPKDEEFSPDHSDERSKFRRYKMSEISAAGWLLSGFSLMISLTLIVYVVGPILFGNTTAWDMMLSASFQVEGTSIKITLQCMFDRSTVAFC